MARKLRLIYPGVAVHIIQRGVNRVPCFRADTDYLVYLSQLRQYAAEHGCAVHAYCLMTNHVHILVTPAREGSCAIWAGATCRTSTHVTSARERFGRAGFAHAWCNPRITCSRAIATSS